LYALDPSEGDAAIVAGKIEDSFGHDPSTFMEKFYRQCIDSAASFYAKRDGAEGLRSAQLGALIKARAAWRTHGVHMPVHGVGGVGTGAGAGEPLHEEL
jgi:hypothetical protein